MPIQSQFRTLLLATAISLLPAGAAPAQTAATERATERAVFTSTEPHRDVKEGKVVHAIRVSTPPTLDGRLNDEVWGLADAATDFVQRDPDNGKPMTQGNRLQVVFDDHFIYVAVTNLDAVPVSAGLGRRDEAPPTDSITIGFDPRHDHQTAYAFQTNPSGWQGDFTYSDDTRRDFDYNAVWDVRTDITARGWTAEFRIPFSQMRFSASPEPGQIWGFNGQRQIRRTSETGTWVGKPRGESGEVSFFGHLVFDGPLPSPRRLEVVPYVAARSERRVGTTRSSEPPAASICVSALAPAPRCPPR